MISFLLFSLSIQPTVHYALSDNFGVEYRKMKAEGKTHLKLRDCEYRVEKGDLNSSGCFVLDKSTKISGQGCGMTTLVGVCLVIQGKKSEGIVEIEDLTIKGAKRNGLWACQGMKVIMRGCTVEDCGGVVWLREKRTSPATTSK